MKTLQELFELMGTAAEKNNKFNHWFFDFSGHVNKLSIRYYKFGWAEDRHAEELDVKVTEDGIQAAYWFIKSNLKG